MENFRDFIWRRGSLLKPLIMDLSYVFSNSQNWVASVQSAGFDLLSLTNSIKDILVILNGLPNDQIEDIVYRLKICHEQSKGKTIENDPDSKTISRISLQINDKAYFFKLLNSEDVSKKKKNLFYCEICGLKSTVDPKNVRIHIKAFHS